MTRHIVGNHFQAILGLLDLLALIAAFQAAMFISEIAVERFGTSSLEEFYRTAGSHQIVYFVLSSAILLYFYLGGHYTRRVPWWSQIRHIVKIFAIALIIDGFASAVLGLYYSRVLIVTNWSFAFAFVLMVRFAGNRIKSAAPAWKLPTVIIGDGDTVVDTLHALSSDPGMGLEARAVLLRDKNPGACDREDFPKPFRNVEVRDGLNGYEEFIRRNPHFFYIVSLETFRGDRRDSLLDLLGSLGADFALIPATSRVSLYNTEPVYFFGNDVMLLRPRFRIVSLPGRLVKRAMDIVGSLIALAIFALPMAVVAVMLKVEGQGGTPFYGGMRVGKDGKLFRCWKFRSMEPGTDHLLHERLASDPQAKAYWDRYFKLPDDPRVQTRTSRFIRKASIDEIPQLLNVLKGDMSLVGPRPILENEIAAYGRQYPAYTAVRPGITGLWQVSGRNEASFQQRVQWDSWYVRNWSLWGDIVIILKTIKVVLSKAGAS